MQIHNIDICIFLFLCCFLTLCSTWDGWFIIDSPQVGAANRWDKSRTTLEMWVSKSSWEPQWRLLGFTWFRRGRLDQWVNGHSRNRFIGGTYHIWGLYKAYLREYPPKIWPYMVQYLLFRILEFPLNEWDIVILKSFLMFLAITPSGT